MTPAEKKFWVELAEIGKEVLEQGREMGFGTSLIELKFQNGQPSIIIRSMSRNMKYRTNQDAYTDLMKELGTSEHDAYDGARTFTVVFEKGNIGRVLLDEYRNKHLV